MSEKEGFLTMAIFDMGDFEQMRFLMPAILREKEMLFGAVCVDKNILHKKSIFGHFGRKRIFYK